MVKINTLELENIKRIRAVRMEPSQNGLTVIGGLLASTVLTLVVVPILYLWMSGRTDRRREKKAKRQEKRQARIERQLQEVGK